MESGTELPHEKFHPASYGVKILLTISKITKNLLQKKLQLSCNLELVTLLKTFT